MNHRHLTPIGALFLSGILFFTTPFQALALEPSEGESQKVQEGEVQSLLEGDVQQILHDEEWQALLDAYEEGQSLEEIERGFDLSSLLEGIDLASLLGGGGSSSSSSSSSSSGDALSTLFSVLDLLGVTERRIRDCTIASIKDQTYTGKEIKPNPQVTYEGTKLKKGTDYTLTYSNNVSVGTGKVTVVGKGNYTGQKTVSFKIVKGGSTSSSSNSSSSSSSSKKNVSFKVTLSQNSYVYTGKEKKPTVKVTASGKSVTKSSYTITYKNNIKVGIATVTVKGTGDYKGVTGEATFKITLKKTSLKTASKAGEGEIKVTWTADTQAGGYELQASTNKSFSSPKKLEVTGGSKSTATFTGLTSGKKYYVRIRSFKEVDGSTWQAQWSAAKEVTVN